MTTTLGSFLVGFADEISQRVHPVALVDAGGEGLDYEIRVQPVEDGLCPFIVHMQSDDEISIEFGEFSVAHFGSSDRGSVVESCRAMVRDILGGAVRETVWSREGVPCRAVAHVGEGDAAVTFDTRSGLCLRAERRDHRYVAYPAAGEGPDH